LAAKTKEFTCNECKKASIKSVGPYYKQLREHGFVLCVECANIRNAKSTSERMAAKYLNNKNVDMVEVKCDCGVVRKTQRRQLKQNKKCFSCTAKESRATNKEIYDNLSKNRRNNSEFGEAVSRGMLLLSQDKRIEIAHAGADALWKNEDNKNKELARRKTEEYKDFMRSVQLDSVDDFITKAVFTHGQKYDYSNISYTGSYDQVLIKCPIHGEFKQTPRDHLQGCGCQKCACSISVSKWHLEVNEFIKSVYNGEIVVNDRNVLSPKEVDVFLPSLNVAVELHGLYRHSFGVNETKKQTMRHSVKADLAKSANISLMQILDVEWYKKQDIVKSMILHKIGFSSRVWARKCEVSTITSDQALRFFNENHIQGHRPASLYYGLLIENEIVAAISISKHHVYGHELIRYTNKLNTTVVGGFSRLLRYSKINKMVTYADRRFSVGDVYEKTGFKLLSVTKPNYHYVKNGVLFSRQLFQKHKLKDKLELYDDDLSESANMFKNGYKRFWDAGHYKLIFNSED